MPGRRGGTPSNIRGGGSPRSNPGRGRGRGKGGGRGRGRGSGLGHSGQEYIDALDFPIQQWSDDTAQRPATPRGGGRGRGRATAARGNSGSGTPRGRGRGGMNSPAPRGQHGRGRGRLRLPQNAPLSQLLHEDRPLLKPVIFVPSVHTRTLFEEKEELLQAAVEEAGEAEESHVPTADRVSRIFSDALAEEVESSSSDEDVLPQIDFQNLDELQEETNNIPLPSQSEAESQAIITREQFTGFYIDTTPAVHPSEGADREIVAGDAIATGVPLGTDAEAEEIIVYVAPYPRIGVSSAVFPPAEEAACSIPPTTSPVRANESSEVETPLNDPDETKEASAVSPEKPAALSFESVSFSFSQTATPRKQPHFPPVFSIGGRNKMKSKARVKEARAARRRLSRKVSFGAFGAMASEARLHDEDGIGGKKDPRWEERRRDDSDVDWGEDDDKEEQSSGLGGMDLDPDLHMDLTAMETFANGVGGAHVTMDDIADMQRMSLEDAGSSESSSESREEGDETILSEEERMLGESAGGALDGPSTSTAYDESESEDSSGLDETPNTRFKTRLERLRSDGEKKTARRAVGASDDSSGDEDEGAFPTWADDDEDFIADLDEMISGKRKLEMSRKILNGDFSEEELMQPARRGPKKKKDIPPELQEVWQRDRDKKAERKRKREQERLQAAADPLAPKTGGRKGRKAARAAARLDPESMPNMVVNMRSLEGQIRRFLADPGGRRTMALSPMDRTSRKAVHELAVVFGLSSESKGRGTGRYTMLYRTQKSAWAINEQKVGRVMQRYKWLEEVGGFSRPTKKVEKGKKGDAPIPRHKDGDVVGHAAPKIGAANLGFKMLAAMGWADGDRIGASASGLDAPLTAVIKNTKLGLGAASKGQS